MHSRNTPSRYRTATIALHWLMLALLVAVYACIELRELFPRGSATRDALKTWHFMLGLSVFVLIWLRLALRFSAPTPPISPPPPRWQQLAAGAVHLALYALMVGMPIGGWLILSAEAKPVPFFGLTLPPLVAPDKAFAHFIEDIHVTVGTIGYWLIGLHAAAAVFHHHVMRDDTLLRMLPRRRD